MKKLLSTKYSAGAFNAAMLFLRVIFGSTMLMHGYQKLVGFNSMAPKFMNFMGIGSTPSLILVIFAEFFCALFVIIGLFTRLSSLFIIITMGVAVIKAHHADVFGDGEAAFLFLGAYLVLLLVGPGRISVDGMMGK